MLKDVALRIGVVDDHQLFRKGLISLIKMVCPDCDIAFEASNGSELPTLLQERPLPSIILMDVNMPRMDGFSSVEWLRSNFPDIKILVVSMIESEEAIVKMLRLGVRGYLCKDVEPRELGEALRTVAEKGFYYTDFITGKLIHALQNSLPPVQQRVSVPHMNEQEKKFLQFACSEMTYYEIANKMFLSPKTIDGYRNSLFEKLQVKSRVGLALYAVRNGLVRI
ncbi:MAG: response regulator transcription factor [Chryseolinea sp.]